MFNMALYYLFDISYMYYIFCVLQGKDARVQPNRALDCGAGIGRITKRLLLNLFKTVDMVELNQKFLDQAPEFLGTELASRVERRICCGLQDFQPEPQRYDVIWCQWVLGHLTDDDLVTFFKRCQSGLSKKGIIIVKENVNASGKVDFDEDDSSYTRPLGVLVDLIRRAGLTVHKQKKQTGFPIGLYEVHMFALS